MNMMDQACKRPALGKSHVHLDNRFAFPILPYTKCSRVEIKADTVAASFIPLIKVKINQCQTPA